jgi:hypothetical protein
VVAWQTLKANIGERGCAADLQRIVVGEIQYEECRDLLIALTARVGSPRTFDLRACEGKHVHADRLIHG